MHRIAIIQFPGSNCEYETRRAVQAAGMEGVFVRWNEDAHEVRKFDAYILPGGFSYEDRVRSGAIAARDPIMDVIKGEAEKGKPMLGICNGAQILVEAGIIPGINSHGRGVLPYAPTIQGALSANNHGWLNIWVSIINEGAPGKTPFNNYPKDHHFRLPIAHGEGRFVIPKDTLKQLIANGQTVFRYCDEHGAVKNEFPVNPNGAVDNLAGICNPAGNVLALMPHPERVKEGRVIFESLREYLERHTPRPFKAPLSRGESPPTEGSPRQNGVGVGSCELEEYVAPENALELFIDLVITDNEAVTLEQALRRMGFENVKVAKKTHWEIMIHPSLGSPLTRGENTHQGSPPNKGEMKERVLIIRKLIASGELLNTNKEVPFLRADATWYGYRDHALQEIPALLEPARKNILVRHADDYEGVGKLKTLRVLGFGELQSVKKGVVWHIEISTEDWEKFQKTNILFNPYSQTAFFL